MFFAQKHNSHTFLRIFKTFQFEHSARRIQQFSQYQLSAEKIVTPVQHLVPIFNPYNQQKTLGQTKRKMEMMSESYLTCCINFCIKGGETEILKIHSCLLSRAINNRTPNVASSYGYRSNKLYKQPVGCKIDRKTTPAKTNSFFLNSVRKKTLHCMMERHVVSTSKLCHCEATKWST